MFALAIRSFNEICSFRDRAGPDVKVRCCSGTKVSPDMVEAESSCTETEVNLLPNALERRSLLAAPLLPVEDMATVGVLGREGLMIWPELSSRDVFDPVERGGACSRAFR